MNDEHFLKVHEDLKHEVADDRYQCLTCNQTYEEYANMTAIERTTWLMRWLP